MSMSKSLIALCLAAPLISAYAMDGEIVKSTPMKDGTTLHQFKDGKMAMEDKFGRPMRMEPGELMTTVDGAVVTMVGDEVARLARVQKAHNARSIFPLSVRAADFKSTENSMELQDGSTLYTFQDGKMGVKDLYGKARTVQEGAVLVTKAGGKVVMAATDNWRLQNFLKPNGH